MRTFIRKYFQEIIALLLIAGFWGGLWGYHAYTDYQDRQQIEQQSVPLDPADIDPPGSSPAPTTQE